MGMATKVTTEEIFVINNGRQQNEHHREQNITLPITRIHKTRYPIMLKENILQLRKHN
jgi:hypothetical protein